VCIPLITFFGKKSLKKKDNKVVSVIVYINSADKKSTTFVPIRKPQMVYFGRLYN